MHVSATRMLLVLRCYSSAGRLSQRDLTVGLITNVTPPPALIDWLSRKTLVVRLPSHLPKVTPSGAASRRRFGGFKSRETSQRYLHDCANQTATMAEVLGVVSSAIAVAELAGKFGLSVMKLKQLWDEIQDIPEEMNRIMRQLEILKPVLAGMEADFVQQQRHNVYSNSATNLHASIEYCRDAGNDLESLAEDLEVRISTAKRSRRNITKLKVSFKKEDIRKYQERIGWALHLISLSQQSYMMWAQSILAQTLNRN